MGALGRPLRNPDSRGPGRPADRTAPAVHLLSRAPSRLRLEPGLPRGARTAVLRSGLRRAVRAGHRSRGDGQLPACAGGCVASHGPHPGLPGPRPRRAARRVDGGGGPPHLRGRPRARAHAPRDAPVHDPAAPGRAEGPPAGPSPAGARGRRAAGRPRRRPRRKGSTRRGFQGRALWLGQRVRAARGRGPWLRDRFHAGAQPRVPRVRPRRRVRAPRALA